MKVLFDHNVPRDLAPYLENHEIRTARQMAWDTLRNGLLLQAAEDAGFEVFITCDQDIVYQQNLATRKIAIIELRKNNWPSLEPHTDKILSVLNASGPGTYATIECAYVYRPKVRRQ